MTRRVRVMPVLLVLVGLPLAAVAQRVEVTLLAAAYHYAPSVDAFLDCFEPCRSLYRHDNNGKGAAVGARVSIPVHARLAVDVTLLHARVANATTDSRLFTWGTRQTTFLAAQLRARLPVVTALEFAVAAGPAFALVRSEPQRPFPGPSHVTIGPGFAGSLACRARIRGAPTLEFSINDYFHAVGPPREVHNDLTYGLGVVFALR